MEKKRAESGLYKIDLSLLNAVSYLRFMFVFVRQQLWLLSKMVFRQGVLCCIYHCNLR